MKITTPEGLQQTRTEKVQPKKNSVGPANFDNELRKALIQTDPDTAVKKASRLSEPISIQSITGPGFKTAYVDRTTRVIDLMETYANALSNPQKTLKDIEPELMKFMDEAQHLHEEYLKSGKTNTELKKIMEDLLRAARLEGARFNRGDYLDSE